MVPAVWSRYTDLVIDHGRGSWLTTIEGDRYLDFSAGIGVASTGHAHPIVVAAVQEQAAKLLHGQQNLVFHMPGLRLHEKLRYLLPGGDWGAFLANSGAEAVEAAVKLARAATGRPAIVAFRGGFHGRTAQAMALTSSRVNVRARGPLPAGVYLAPYPYCYRSPLGPHSPLDCRCTWEAELMDLFEQVVRPSEVAAFIVEPVLGEGGYVVPPAGFLPRLREIADLHGIRLIADEIQTGYGRTGRMFAVEHQNVRPDILTIGKGLASGLPLSGIIARSDLFDAWSPGDHGGTYGGNVVASAAALATLDVIEAESLVANAETRGRQLLEGLKEATAGNPKVGDVRGLGCMVAMEFVAGPNDRTPDPEAASAVIKAALRRRLIVMSAGSYGQVVRIIPPLVTTEDEVEHAIAVLQEAVAEVGA